MPTFIPTSWKFKPLTTEVMEALGGVLEGTLEDVGNSDGYEALVLRPRNRERDGVVYTHPTLFHATTVFVRNTINGDAVRVSLKSGKLRLQLMSSGSNTPPNDSPVFETEPVLLRNVSPDLVDTFNRMISSPNTNKCAKKSACTGAQYSELDRERTVLVRLAGKLELICQHCYFAHHPTNRGELVLMGREIPPRVTDRLWDILHVRRIC